MCAHKPYFLMPGHILVIVSHVIVNYVDLSRDTFIRPTDVPMSKDGESLDKRNLTRNSGVITRDDTIKDRQIFQPESTDSSLL